MGLGITMIYAVTKMFNFAHGEFMTIGAYITAMLTSFYNLNLALAVIFSFIISGAIAVFISELIYEPLIKKRVKTILLFIASIAVGISIRNIIYMIVIPRNLFYVKTAIPTRVVFTFGGGNVTNVFLYVVPTTFVLVLLLHLMLTKTKLGTAMRCVAENSELAQIVGVNVRNIRRIAWVISGGLAGVAGALWAVYLIAYPEVGWVNLLSSFTASYIGGLISFSGTIVGGYIVGIGENLVMKILNKVIGVDVGYKLLITFSILVSIMLFKPTGLAEISLPKIKFFRKNLTKLNIDNEEG
jgi:branched-subunit amino acid ABC-type transport system permease component